MAYLKNIKSLLLALVLMYQKTVTSDFFSPITDGVCKEVNCGKGNCKASSNTTFMYECECEDGWKQFDHQMKFLPCIIPNCTLDASCGQAASPSQPKSPFKDSNASFFDICSWIDCRGGVCNKTMPFSYTCECNEGHDNLLNISTFPCFKQCAFGMDCLNLGIPVSNSSSLSPPSLPDSTKNQATRLNLRASSSWWIITSLFYMSQYHHGCISTFDFILFCG